MEYRNRYPAEVRERAVRLVLEHTQGYSSQWAAIISIAAKIGCTPETLRRWVRCEEVDSCMRNGLYPLAPLELRFFAERRLRFIDSMIERIENGWNGDIQGYERLKREWLQFKKLDTVSPVAFKAIGMVKSGKSLLLNALISDCDDQPFKVGVPPETQADQSFVTDGIEYIDSRGLFEKHGLPERIGLSSEGYILVHDPSNCKGNIDLLDKTIRTFKEEMLECPGSSYRHRLLIVLTNGGRTDSSVLNTTRTYLDSVEMQNIPLIQVDTKMYFERLNTNRTDLMESGIPQLRLAVRTVAPWIRSAVLFEKCLHLCDKEEELAKEIRTEEEDESEEYSTHPFPCIDFSGSSLSSKAKKKEGKLIEKYNEKTKELIDKFNKDLKKLYRN